jgi:hypothetical protein
VAGETSSEGCNTDTVTGDTQGKTESCTASNNGVSTSVSLRIKVDKTPPTVTEAVPDRSPDANGWYNRPLGVSYHGTDATSGVATCTTTGYTGPATPNARVFGTCRDNAGNTSAPVGFGFKYDATVPVVRASGAPLNRAVVLRWSVSSNTRTVAVRRAALAGRRTHVSLGRRIYRGDARRLRDTNLRNGLSYLYTVEAISRSGLVATAKVEASPTPLFGPRPGMRVSSPPLLRWAAVPGATYYNVQLRRNGRKVLSSWPAQTSLQLHWRWSFAHRRVRFAAGRYTWVVWPGFGSPAQARYGRLLGRSTFVVKR